jgi:hypothetical protein
MKIVDLRKFNKGQIRAFFHVEHDGFLMRDFKLMESATGFWVSFPKKAWQKDGQPKWEPTVELSFGVDTPEGKKLIELLSALARDEYQGAK